MNSSAWRVGRPARPPQAGDRGPHRPGRRRPHHDRRAELPAAAVINTATGRVFVKGLPSGHRKVITQDREAALAPLVTVISPSLLWHFDEAGWNVICYQYAPGRHAGYRPG